MGCSTSRSGNSPSAGSSISSGMSLLANHVSRCSPSRIGNAGKLFGVASETYNPSSPSPSRTRQRSISAESAGASRRCVHGNDAAAAATGCTHPAGAHPDRPRYPTLDSPPAAAARCHSLQPSRSPPPRTSPTRARRRTRPRAPGGWHVGESAQPHQPVRIALHPELAENRQSKRILRRSEMRVEQLDHALPPAEC